MFDDKELRVCVLYCFFASGLICNQDGRESRIFLNESPDTLSKVLQWLYIGHFDWADKGGVRVNGKPTTTEVLSIGRLPGPHHLHTLHAPAGGTPDPNDQYAADLASVYVFADKFEMPVLRAVVVESIVMWIRTWVGYGPERIFKLAWNALPDEHRRNHAELRMSMASIAAEVMIDEYGNLDQDLRNVMSADNDFCLKVADSLAYKCRLGQVAHQDAELD